MVIGLGGTGGVSTMSMFLLSVIMSCNSSLRRSTIMLRSFLFSAASEAIVSRRSLLSSWRPALAVLVSFFRFCDRLQDHPLRGYAVGVRVDGARCDPEHLLTHLLDRTS